MGSVETIDASKFPKQGRDLNKTVKVCFNYDLSRQLSGVVVRDDAEEPFQTIIKLDDGRYVLTTECMYSPTV